ncbi:MAG: VWA domain-containing protein [Promethearchaeota archaeon]
MSVRSEDIIFCVDMSRSMYRRDFEGGSTGKKSRILAIVEAVNQFVEAKHEIDASDRFGVILFNGTTTAMEDLVFSPSEISKFLVDNVDLRKGSALGEGLALAVKTIVKELRKIGEKQQRVVLLTDGIFETTAVNPIKIAKIANGLGIIIDAIRVGPAKIPGAPIKRICELTQGRYFYATDEGEMEEALDILSRKKEIETATLLDNRDTSVKNIFEDEIADQLLKIEDLTDEQKKTELYIPMQEGKLKCSICYSSICPTCHVNFLGCGRFCPNCLKPIHLHCAINWAEQQAKGKKKSSGTKIFRCPHCFYLLKIPTTTMQKPNAVVSEPEYGAPKVTIRSRPFDEEAPQIYDEVCGVCSSLFDSDEDERVYKCECGAYFHEECLREVWHDEKICPVCGKSAQIEE